MARTAPPVRGWRTACARAALALVALLAPGALAAQTVRGMVVDGADRPVPGVVVTLLAAAPGVPSVPDVVARALTNERGEYRLAPGRAGTYRVRTLRIGYRPVVSEPMTLAAGEDVARRLVLASIALALDTVRVADRAACRLARDSAAATFAVWEQARAALTATQITSLGGRAGGVSATATSYDRTLDGDARRVRAQSVSVTTGFVSQPWRALPPDSLRRVGYVVDEAAPFTGAPVTVYYAPGLDALASAGFLEDHCFRLVGGGRAGGHDGADGAYGASVAEVGVAFEPTRERRGRAEIAGTLWLDRRTAELRRLEFRYVNVARERAEHAGGEMAFARLRGGGWAIARWSVRMPVVATVVPPRGPPTTRVEEVRVTGGELSLVTRGADTLWARPPLTLAGAVIDSATGAPIAGARVTLFGTAGAAVADARGRFAIAAVLPGAYTAEVRTPSLDSAGAAHRTALTFADAATPVTIRAPNGAQLVAALCPRGGSVVLGTARLRGDTAPAADARVVAEWTELGIGTPNGGSVDARRVTAEARAGATGVFRLCGVPRATAITLRAAAGSAGASPVTVRLGPDERFARADLVLDPARPPSASLAGIVRADSTDAPIADVEVSIPALGRSARTDAGGAFRLDDVPPGAHQVVVRRLGYGPLDTTLSLAVSRTTERRFVLTRVHRLEAVNVATRRTAAYAGLSAMAERQRLGLGRFLDSAALRAHEHRKLPDVLRDLNVDIRPAMLCDPPPRVRCRPDPTRKVAFGGTRGTCLMQVYLDGVLVYRGAQVPDWDSAFDLNAVPVSELAGAEVYRRAAQLPGEYAGTGAGCGLLALWTRR